MQYQISWHSKNNRAGDAERIRKLPHNGSLTVGREIGADIVLDDQSVSRLHAEITATDQGVFVRDSGSANGVLINGDRVSEINWLPQQELVIGSYVFRLEQADGARIPSPPQPPVATKMGRIEAAPAPINYTRLQETDRAGRINLGELYQRARSNDKQAIMDLFAGFLGTGERVVDCGYLGVLGIIIPEHSFYCVSNTRVCGLMVRPDGQVTFTFGFIKALNIARFNQPSILLLWLFLISWFIFVMILCLPILVTLLNSGFYGILYLLPLVLIIGVSILLVPWLIRLFYRFTKSGCVFWNRENRPIFLFADRNNLKGSQRLLTVFHEQKEVVGS